MSCYMVGDDHINLILSYAKLNRVWFKTDGTETTKYSYCQGATTLQKIGEMLAKANAESCNERYPDDSIISDDHFKYVFDSVVNKTEAKQLAAMILSACDCYNYQTENVKNYMSTDAFHFIDAVKNAAIKILLLGYPRTWNYVKKNQL